MGKRDKVRHFWFSTPHITRKKELDGLEELEAPKRAILSLNLGPKIYPQAYSMDSTGHCEPRCKPSIFFKVNGRVLFGQ